MKTSLKMIVAVIGLLEASVSTADAADTLYTSAQLRAGRIFDCNVVNVGSSPVTVTVEFVTTFNTVELFAPDVVIPPGQIAPFSASSGPGTSPYLYCRFTVTSGKISSVRASYCVNDADGNCVAAGDAR